SLTFAENKEKSKKSEKSESTSEITSVTSESTGVTISKGESFMAAFGMGDSVAGGESGMSSSAGMAGIAGNIANTAASNLTSSQNTPYSYK
ncbi:MAG: hypothetical protein ACRC6A_10690, partial [Fusobacteriaceae bacterium]